MKLKRIIILISVISAIVLTACGTENNNKTQHEENYKSDETNIKADDAKEKLFDYIRAGLYARWDIVLSNDYSELTEDEYKASFMNPLYAEKNMTENYKDYLTEDSELTELIKAYYVALDNQIKAVDLDEGKVNMELYQEKGHYARAEILMKLYDEYGFDVSEEYRYCMNTMMYARELDDLLDVLVEKCRVKIVENDSSGQRIKIEQMENNSDFSLLDVYVEFCLYDDVGKEIYTAKSDIVPSWKSGSKVDFIFQEKIPRDIVDKQKSWGVYFRYEDVDFDN